MAEEYSIIHNDNPDDAALTVVGQGMGMYNEEQAGDQHYQRLSFFLHAPDGEVVGGLVGSTYWDWFYVDWFFVKEELRGLGHGHRLLMQAEDEARKRGAKNAYLDTFSFQVPDFYKDHGYHVFGELQDFPTGHQRFFFTKEL